MPIYEYQCNACGHDIEKLQRINDEPLRDCPDCGKPELVRLVSAAGFRLKGSGWYETDFKKSGKKNLHEGGSSPGAKPADKPAASESSKTRTSAAKSSAD